MSIVKVLPVLRAAGGAQMALDDGLLDGADTVTARRYVWAPPALSVGKFQKVPEAPGLPFDVVRRPSGGRAVLHGEEFEWSFAVVFAPDATIAGGQRASGARAGLDVAVPYELVAGAFAAALSDLEVPLDGGREKPYQRSALCFASTLRYDLLARGEKVLAMAQARRAGRVLVHGSVLERRPPDELVNALEALLGEPWQGEGLAGAGVAPAAEMIWNRVLVRLEAALRGLAG